jgi:exonuclease VII small subunit
MALTPKQRQAKRRAEMAIKGKKQLALGFVDEQLHEPIKRVVAQLESGEVELTESGEIAKFVRDEKAEGKLREELNSAQGEIDRLKNEIAKANTAFKVQKDNTSDARRACDKAVKANEQWKAKTEKLKSELAQFERTWFGYYKKN